MARLKLTDRHRRYLAVAVAVVAGLMAVDVVFQIVRHAQWRAFIPAVSEAATTQPSATQPATQAAEPTPAPAAPPKPIEIAAAIKARNIFAAPPEKGHGMSLCGVLGNVALFNARGGAVVAIEAGQSANGVTVKSIDGYEVVIEYEGKPETLRLFPPSPGQDGPGAPPAPPPTATSPATQPATQPTNQPTSAPAAETQPAQTEQRK
ncbi:MAG: hypothetical protein GXY33_22430 [Phycisphaerae bacterium]|nr:hypothetical protein [Phycisphaerae bacterium]